MSTQFKNHLFAIACWVYRHPILAAGVFVFGVPSVILVIATVANSLVLSPNIGLWAMVGGVTAYVAFVAGFSWTVYRPFRGDSQLQFAPSYTPCFSQAQIHLRKLTNGHKLRSMLRLVHQELQTLNAFDVRRVSMDSPLIADTGMQGRLVERFNEAFDKSGAPWRAVGHAAKPFPGSTLMFVLSYHRTAFLAKEFPNCAWLQKRLRSIPPERLNTWKNLRRDPQGRILFGRILFVATS